MKHKDIIMINRSDQQATPPQYPDYDIDYTKLEQINAATDQLIDKLTTCCCNSCVQCMHAMAECTQALCTAFGDAIVYAGKKIIVSVEETSKVVLLPPIRAFDDVVRGPNNNDCWELPKDIAMFAVNPLMTMAEIFMKANGDPAVIPFQPAVARSFECVNLLTSGFKSQLTWDERLKRTAAGLTALVFASYAALYAFTLADLTQDGTVDQLIPALPNDMIQQLHVSTWHALQWTIACLGSYVMMTDGYIFGKELILKNIPHEWRALQTDIKVDAITRHLMDLEKIQDPKIREEAQLAFQKQIHENTGLWNFIDVLGRTIEHVLSFALTTPIRVARDTASNLTSYKPVIGKLQNYKEKIVQHLPSLPNQKPAEEEKQLLNPEEVQPHRLGCCAKTAKVFTGCFFHTPAVNKSAVDENKQYDDVIGNVKNSYNSYAPATLYNGREQRLQNDIRDYYTKAMRRYQQTGEIDVPFGTKGEPANADWKTEALNDERIKAFLNGDIANTGLSSDTSFAKMAFHYNQQLFGYYNKVPDMDYSAPVISA